MITATLPLIYSANTGHGNRLKALISRLIAVFTLLTANSNPGVEYGARGL
jgi:hypothetical protein